QMRAAAGALHLDALHAERPVALRVDDLRGERREEARPAGAGVELRLGREQRVAAGDADERSGRGPVLVLAGERAFGPLVAGDAVLLGGEDLVPLSLGADDLVLAGVQESVAGYVDHATS